MLSINTVLLCPGVIMCSEFLFCCIDRFAPFPSCYSPPTPFSPTRNFKPHGGLFALRTCVLGTDCPCASVTSSLARTWPRLASQTHTQLPNSLTLLDFLITVTSGGHSFQFFPSTHPVSDVSAPPNLVQT